MQLRPLVLAVALFAGLGAGAAQDPLPAWNDGAAKQAILSFVKAATDSSSPQYVQPANRIATFDQDGTLWVEHPFYTELEFTLDRVAELAPQHPAWKKQLPYSAVLARDKAAMAKFTTKDLEALVVATHTGMSVDAFHAAVKAWIAKAKDPRWHRPYTSLTYEPMLEAMRYLRANGFRTYIVTGGGQEFVRVFAQAVYGVPPDQVIGSAGQTQFDDKNGQATLMKTPKLLLNDNLSGKPEDIYLFIGRRPAAAFGNSDGDRQMLEYAQKTGGGGLMMLVLHDDAQREYAYGPATGLPNSKIGTFPQSLYDEAKARGWTVISMRRDWKRIFSWNE